MATRPHIVEDGRGNVVETGTTDVPPEETNLDSIQQAARQALVNNRAFVNAAKPGTAGAQASAAYDQAKALTRQMNGVIRLLLGALDATD